MILFQEAPAQTTGYMIAGYTIIFTVIAVYLISIYLRSRSLKQDLQMLDELERKNQ